MSDSKFDPHRRLCPDGACIGIIGSDGRCRVCGRTAGGGKDAAPPDGFVPAADEDRSEDDETEAEDRDDTRAEAGAARNAGAAAGFDPNRRLCPDGSCLGVIGADGVCNVCGQKAG
jgi:hypothetical protein